MRREFGKEEKEEVEVKGVTLEDRGKKRSGNCCKIKRARSEVLKFKAYGQGGDGRKQ